jgi:hypothetical protein
MSRLTDDEFEARFGNPLTPQELLDTRLDRLEDQLAGIAAQQVTNGERAQTIIMFLSIIVVILALILWRHW